MSDLGQKMRTLGHNIEQLCCEVSCMGKALEAQGPVSEDLQAATAVIDHRVSTGLDSVVSECKKKVDNSHISTQ